MIGVVVQTSRLVNLEFYVVSGYAAVSTRRQRGGVVSVVMYLCSLVVDVVDCEPFKGGGVLIQLSRSFVSDAVCRVSWCSCVAPSATEQCLGCPGAAVSLSRRLVNDEVAWWVSERCGGSPSAAVSSRRRQSGVGCLPVQP